MKKLMSLLLSAVLLITVIVMPVSAENGEINIISPDKNTVIAVPDDIKDDERLASETLRKYLEEITGRPFFIVKDSTPLKGNKIYVGFDNDAALAEGSYSIREEDGNIYIRGRKIRGEISGVYAFLEKFCSCRWFTSEVKVIPKTDIISVEKGLDYNYKPYFECTDTNWRSASDHEYAMAHGITAGTWRHLSKEEGGSVNYISEFCHTLSTQFCSSKKYFESNPEYFALRTDEKGKQVRVPDQLCLTNPDVLKIVTDEVLALCKERHDPNADLQIISLTQHDNGNFCTCDKCRALDEKNDSHSGTMITFVNEVAKAVKAAGYDNIAIDTFAYTYTRKAPTQVKPEPNVIVRICTIECCFSHPLNDKNCKVNADFMKDFSDWGKICNRLYIWDYTNNFNYTINIYPNFEVLQKNIQLFYENNVKGLFEQGNSYMNRCDGEFGELKSYLLSKLMQDPYLDYETTKNEFLQAYYGKSWEKIDEFISFTCKKEAESSKHMGIRQIPADTLYGITDEEIAYLDALWADAEELAENETYLEHVKRSELSWRFWKYANRKAEFSRKLPAYKWITAVDDFCKDIDEAGITQNAEAANVPRNTTVRLLLPINKWKDKYDSNLLLILADPLCRIVIAVSRMINTIVSSC